MSDREQGGREWTWWILELREAKRENMEVPKNELIFPSSPFALQWAEW